jgi:organic hydroperoxide reductase OsmC/OhrA
MFNYTAAIEWTRNGSEFKENEYSGAHAWRFVGGFMVPATNSSHIVAVPASNRVNVHPEEAFVAALSSNHMLCFLEIAAIFGYIVERYSDTPEASIATNSAGNFRVDHVILQPAILFTGAKVPTEAAVMALHRAAHAECPLANSVSTVVETLGVWHHEPCVDSSAE